MRTFLITVAIVLVVGGLLFGVNYMAMYATFIRATPVVTGSAIYSDKSVNLYLLMEGHIHNAVGIIVIGAKKLRQYYLWNVYDYGNFVLHDKYRFRNWSRDD